MTATIERASAGVTANRYAAGQLPNWAPWATLAGAIAVSFILTWLLAAGGDSEFNVVGASLLAALLYVVAIVTLSVLQEGRRKATDRLVTSLVVGAFILAIIPLVSLAWTTIVAGAVRFDVDFFTMSMRGVVGEGGGALHAIVGTLQITLVATIISVPIGLMTAIYLVEYGRGALARGITFVVDVMTGIPSIVAGLFAYALFSFILGPGIRSGLAGAISLSVLMIPIVVRSSEEMLRLVPHELREASFALGVPKWLTIINVVLPTSIAGVVTGIVLAIARVIGETAPLLLTAGYIASMNWDVFNDRMASLPLFVYQSYRNWGGDVNSFADLDRAWTGALVLIIIVMVLNLVARIVAKFFAPKTGR